MKSSFISSLIGLAMCVLALPAVAQETAATHEIDSIALPTATVEPDTLIQAAAQVQDSIPAEQASVPPTLTGVAQMEYTPHHGPDFRLFKSVTNPNVKPYKFLDDQTWVGIPIFLWGIIAKSEKTAFRQDYNNPNTKIRLIKYNFHNEIDNYTQFLPLVATIGMKMGGVENRSDWPRLAASAALSYGIMAGLVNGIKYTASEMRPDGSTANSWPSGHTATAFAAATVFHKEYGLTRSPWYSVAGYAVATFTGVMRVLNNRHWISDVLSGAGIGILSTELAYGLCDLMFKQRGLLRNDLSVYPDLRKNPSFFNISMGSSFGNKNLDLPPFSLDIPDEMLEEGDEITTDPVHLSFRTGTAVGAEGAWFFCPYMGIGGRLRVKATPINGWKSLALSEEEDLTKSLNSDLAQNSSHAVVFSIESDHLTEFTADAGLYFSLPLSSRFALGTKLLVGRSIVNAIDVRAAYVGQKLVLNPDFWDDPNADFLKATDEYVAHEWDYMNVSASNSMKFGTGLSLTFAYKNSFSWRLFCDYDYARKTYTASYNPFEFFASMSPDLTKEMLDAGWDMKKPMTSSVRKGMNQWVLGLALCVSF